MKKLTARELVSLHGDFQKRWVEINGDSESSNQLFCFWFASFVKAVNSPDQNKSKGGLTRGKK